MRRKQRLLRLYRGWKPYLLIAVIFGIVGTLLLFVSHALTPTANTEVEQGTISSCASNIADTSASGGHAVKFAGCSFVHPGIFLDKTQLDLVKAKLTAHTDPWYTQSASMSTKTTIDGYAQVYSSLSYAPHPVSTIDCSVNNPQSVSVCTSMVEDAVAAYTDALLYYYGNKGSTDAYAQKAIDIINQWSGTVSSWNGTQAQLEIAWAAEMFPRAAEILRYTYSVPNGETTLNLSNFNSMLNVFLPAINSDTTPAAASSNGNWRLAMIDGQMNIAVFTDDHTMYSTALARWRAAVPAYIYLPSDGASPVAPPGGTYTTQQVKCYWAGAGSPASSCSSFAGFQYVDGMVQETCRDASHVSLGMSALVYAARTATIQGTDLFNEQKTRLTDALNFTTAYNAAYLNGLNGTAGTWPTSPCGGPPNGSSGGTGGVGYELGAWETWNSELSNRLGVTLDPSVLYYIQNDVRAKSYKAFSNTAWESVTSPTN